MHERIVEIILFLVSELKSNKQLSEIDVSFLSKSGYTASEISSAFSWIFERMTVGQSIVHQKGQSESSFRVLHDAERMVITPEAYGYLLQWRQLGLLTNDEIESIIERIMAAGFSVVGEEEMKSFLAGHLFEHDSRQGIGGRISLSGQDTIH
ncbi:MAG TPA: DUF494 family protein [Bacteroidota bacterium]|nr:DUF494 family protein [Bacteroidota bacterium]